MKRRNQTVYKAKNKIKKNMNQSPMNFLGRLEGLSTGFEIESKNSHMFSSSLNPSTGQFDSFFYRYFGLDITSDYLF